MCVIFVYSGQLFHVQSDHHTRIGRLDPLAQFVHCCLYVRAVLMGVASDYCQCLVTGNSLDRRKINSRLDQMGDSRMAQGVRCDLVRVQPGPLC